MEVSRLSARARRFFDMIEFDENEQLICEIRKHPFGLFLIYLTGTVISVVIFTVLVFAPLAFDNGVLGVSINFGATRTLLALIGFILTVLALVGTAIGAYLYQANVVIVTSEKLAQLLYTNLFNRKISQLSIGDVQDVSVQQIGIFARIFNYGTLVIETAGEQNNYVFTYTPDPYVTGKSIVGSHEENLKRYGN